MEIFALDLGNKQTKMVSSKTLKNEKNGSKVFPSIFCDYEELGEQATLFSSKKKIDKFATTKEDDFEFAWGKEINQVSTDKFFDTLQFNNRYNSREFKLLTTFALGELARDFKEAENGIMECLVVTGVPSDDYSESTIKELMKVLSGDHQVSINETSYNIRVKEVLVMNQPIGTIYNEMLDKEGYIENESYFDDSVTVVDLGGGTFIVDTLHNLQLDQSKRLQHDEGAYSLYTKIIAYCVKDGIKGLDQYKLEQILREADPKEGYYFKPNKNESIDISKQVSKGIKKYTLERMNAISTAVKDTSIISKFIFTGGGANLIDRKITKEKFNYTHFVDDAESANVKGYYKYGQAYQLENSENGD
ncbi:hypothetical protein KM915_20915 [Cytobacillus oceanisediminis]|uniref:ParM/StbA family protein n=1 Tax=Cytobacillus oceanisediminis TaxID=665099 RepID=UPI001C211BF3|nr:plasmid segregation protein ParM domain-containing protein [Cytobacillus oceanisediminis]MBU8732513.1 hypothetical protein [Cytobacillus oceanisediminis]